MNWTKFFSNVGGVAVACVGAHQAMATPGAPIAWGAVGVGVALCVAANLLGLFQQPPHKDPASP